MIGRGFMAEKINYLEKIQDKVNAHLIEISGLKDDLKAKIHRLGVLMNELTSFKLKLHEEEEKNALLTKEKTSALSEIEKLKNKVSALESELSRLKPKKLK